MKYICKHLFFSLFIASCHSSSLYDSLYCSSSPFGGSSRFEVGQFILLTCKWSAISAPTNLNSNGTVNGDKSNDMEPTRTLDSDNYQQPQLAWFRREISGNISELSANHEMTVKWRLAPDDNGIEFLCVPINGSKVFHSPSCSQRPLVMLPEVMITSSPGTHLVGDSNTFTCDATGNPQIETYDWFVNGEQVYPRHDRRFSEVSRFFVDDEWNHRHRYLTFRSLNHTDNGTQITCTAWTTTGISNNRTYLLIINEDEGKEPSTFTESVVLLACLTAGGTPVLFLICVCMVIGIRYARKKRSESCDIDYSGSFKSETDAAPENDTDASLPRRYQTSHAHTAGNASRSHGATASAIQRPNFFRQKLNRLSQMFFAPMRYVDDDSIYENTTPSQTTAMKDLGQADITRGGSLQLPTRPSASSMSPSVSTPMSAPLMGVGRNGPDQNYENFVVPVRDYENTPSILDSPTSPGW